MDSWKTKYLFPAMGMIPIDRSGGDKSQAALDAAEAVLRRGELFGIFPEGTRSRDGYLYKGRTGAARLALEDRLPDLPGRHHRHRRRSSRPTPRLPKLFKHVHDHDRPTDPARALPRPRRRRTSPALDDRRGDVRDPRADRPGVPRTSTPASGRRRKPRCRPRSATSTRPTSRAGDRELVAVERLTPAPGNRPAGDRAGARRLRGAMSNITITLPDGSPREYPAGTHRARRRRVDRARPGQGRRRRHRRRHRDRPDDARCPTARRWRSSPTTRDEGRHVLRHSTAHVMAQAVTQLFPGAKFSIGPAIENGFYYDFELPGGRTFSEDDLAAIEARMREIIDADQPFVAVGGVGRRGARAVRRPAVQARDHRARAAPRPPVATDELDAGEIAPATRSASTATPPSSSTCATARTCRRPAASATSSCRRSPAPTGGATRRARCCSASTARRGSRSRRSTTHLAPARGGREARPPQARHRARPAQLPARARRRPRGVAPEGRHRPQADGGLQPRSATSAAATSSCTRRTSRTAELFETSAATSTGTPTACTRRWRWTTARTT